MRFQLDDLTVTIDGVAKPSSTTITAAGAYVVVVATTLPEQVVQLTSCYLSGLRGPVAVTYLLQVRSVEDRFAHALLEDALAGTTHARRCLLHHAGELQTALAATGRQVLVDVGQAALQAADTVWQPGDGGASSEASD